MVTNDEWKRRQEDSERQMAESGGALCEGMAVMSASVTQLKPVELVSETMPEGVYCLAFERYQVSTRFGRGSLEMWFRVTDFGPYYLRPLCRYFKVDRSGKRSFRVSPHSAFVREFAAVFGRRPPAGIQAIGWFRHDVYVEGLVGTVSKDYSQKTIPAGARYSVIRELQRRIEP